MKDLVARAAIVELCRLLAQEFPASSSRLKVIAETIGDKGLADTLEDFASDPDWKR